MSADKDDSVNKDVTFVLKIINQSFLVKWKYFLPT